jgi:hypothetical protein
MSEPKNYRSTLLLTMCIVACAAAVTFGALWFQEQKRNPKEIVTEVEKPVQSLQPWQQAAIDFNARYRNAKLVENPRGALYKLDSVAVFITVNDDAKKVVSEDNVRTKFELILRKYGIKIDENAVASVEVTITGGSEDQAHGRVLFTYSATVELFQAVVVDRKTDLRRVVARLWNEGLVAWRTGDRGQVEGVILKNVEDLGERFANAYLAAQEQDKTP